MFILPGEEKVAQKEGKKLKSALKSDASEEDFFKASAKYQPQNEEIDGSLQDNWKIAFIVQCVSLKHSESELDLINFAGTILSDWLFKQLNAILGLFIQKRYFIIDEMIETLDLSAK